MEINNQIKMPEETVVYKNRKFNKKHFFIIAAILLGIYLLAIGFIWIGNITNVAKLENFDGTSNYKGNYIEGNVTCRTKALSAAEDGEEKEGWYYFLIPCGKGEKYILVYADENQYEQFKNLPEINPSKGQTQESGIAVPITGKIETIYSPLYQDFQEMLGITVKESTDDNKEDKIQKAKTDKEQLEEREKQELEAEHKMEEMANTEIAIKLVNYRKEQAKQFGIVTILWLVVVAGVFLRGKNWIWEIESREVPIDLGRD